MVPKRATHRSILFTLGATRCRGVPAFGVARFRRKLER